MKLLLDTCSLIWLVAEPGRLGHGAAEFIDDPNTDLWLSDTSVWEICLKWQKGKLRLPAPPRTWVREQTDIWHIAPLPIARTHLFRVTELPTLHQDPFDRLLVAQAIEEGLTIATPDPHIAGYPVAVVW